jgi:aminoglycoside 6'-N-acetyltransferase I
MEEYNICFINELLNTREQAVKVLLEAFPADEMWPDLDEKIALKTVEFCISNKNICIGMKVGNDLAGWVCIRPKYVKIKNEETWELHPLVISPRYKGKGYGKILMEEIEKIAQEKNIIGIILSSGDEANKTSLSEKEISGINILEEIKNIRNYKNHPYEFYQKCGYSIIGIVPNAYGLKKTDIWLWKDIRKK